MLCLLATDDEEDVALQIHFTLIQAFCCENDINILRVSNMRRLAEILGGVKPGGEPMDLHCVLVTVSVITHACLLSHFCALLTSFQTVTPVVVAHSEPVLLLAPRSLSVPAWSACCAIWIICNLFALKQMLMLSPSPSSCRIPSRHCGRTRRWTKWTDSAETAAVWISGCPWSTCPTDETAWNINVLCALGEK